MRYLALIFIVSLLHCLELSAFNSESVEPGARIDAMISKLGTITDVDERVSLLSKIIFNFGINDMDAVNKYFSLLEETVQKTNKKRSMIKYYKTKGFILDFIYHQSDSSIYYVNKAIDMMEDQNLETLNDEDRSLLLMLYNNKAVTYNRSYQKNLAFQQYLMALDLLKGDSPHFQYDKAYIYSNIANLLSGLKRADEALGYIQLAIDTELNSKNKAAHNPLFLTYVLLVKAEILYEQKDYTNAEKALIEIIDSDMPLNIYSNFARILLGSVYLDSNKFELSQINIEQAFEEIEELGDAPYNLIQASAAMGRYHLLTDNPMTALEHLEVAQGLINKGVYTGAKIEVYENLSKALAANGRFEESLEAHILFKNEVDLRSNMQLSIADNQIESKISSIEEQFKKDEFEIREKLQKNKIYALVVCSVLLFMLLIVFFVLYSRKSDVNAILIEKNAEISRSKDQAIAASKAKENFLSTMSHELRTPMNAVIGLTDIMLDENPDAKQREHLNNLKFSGEGLLNIINEVLDFSKIEAGKLELEKKPFDIKLLLDKMINSLRHGNKNNDVKVIQDQELSNLQHLVIGDSKRICQILINLLGNAIKFTPKGQIVLKSQLVEESSTEVKLMFRVKDTGIGIPSNKLDRIFESFSQVNNNINRIHQGTGLGLAITKRLVELKGGEINVVSKEGEGTVFSFTLAFEKSDLIQKSAINSTSTKIFQSGIEGRKILLVEDNKLNQLVALKVLKKFKVEASLAENGQEALEMVQKCSYDLVLMDIHMPIMDGIEATKKIRALEDPRINQIPIIALSADAYSDKLEIANECGMNDYLSKPFKPADLFQKIANNLVRKQGLRAQA